MPHDLKYRIVNAQVVTTEREAELDGETVTVRQNRTIVEAEPVDPAGKTLTLVLPSAVADEFAEGATLTVTITVDQEA